MMDESLAKLKRREQFEDYKSERDPCPPELEGQFPLAREGLNAFGIQWRSQVGYEADDLIATYARKADSQGSDVRIVTHDKDLLQLVGDRIRVVSGDRIMDRARVRQSW